MAVTRFSPWNVNNPRTDHTARLRYGQSLRISLDPPEAYGFPSDCIYVVRSNSSYLRLESQDIIPTKRGEGGEYIFKQEGVPKGWVGLSTLFLGNVQIIARQTKQSNTNDAQPIDTVLGTVCTYLNCNNGAKEDVVTVVAPDQYEFDATVKLEPSQILEVVVADDSLFPLEWRHYLFVADAERSDLSLNKFSEEVLTKGMGLGGGPVNDPLYVERRILPYGDGAMPAFSERHFFFDMNRLTNHSLQNLPNDNYDACTLHFMAWDGDHKVVKEAVIHAVLALRTKIRKRETKRLKSRRKFQESITARTMLESERLLINPNHSEKVFIYGDADELMVELVQPSVLWSISAALLPTARWECCIGSLLIRDRNRYQSITVKELSPRQVNGVVIQRFVLGAKIPKGKENAQELVLGEVVFHCPAITKFVNAHERKLNLVLKRTSPPAKPVGGSYHRPITLEGETYNVIGSTSMYNQPARRSGKKKGKQKQCTIAEHWLVVIQDKDGDLADGEFVEPHSSTRKAAQSGENATPQTHRMGNHGYPSLVDDQFYKDEKAKKKGIGLLAEYEKRKKGSMSVVSGSSHVALVVRERDEKNAMSTYGGKTPLVLYSIQDGDEITLQEGQPLFLQLPMPNSVIGDSKIRSQWCINTVQMDSDLKIWTESNSISVVDNEFVHQEFEVRILTVRNSSKLFGSMRPAQTGIHRAGALHIRCQQGDEVIVRKVFLNLEVTNGSSTPLKWWLDWHRLRKEAKPINFDLPTKPPFSYKEGRVTLINPKGKQDIELKSGDEIEIILGSPFKPHEEQLLAWGIKAAILPGSNGSLHELEQRYYTLINGQQIFRGLYKVTIDEGPFFGEMKLQWDGENTGDCVVFIRDEKARNRSLGLPVPEDKPSLAIAYGELGNSRKIMVQNWENEQHAIVFPTDHVHIQLPRLEAFLDAKYRKTTAQSAWKVEFQPYYLEDSVTAELHPYIADAVDRFNPWEEGMILPSDQPWVADWYVLPPFEEMSDYLDEIVTALRKVHGEQQSYPFATLVFSYNYENTFTLSRTLHLDLGNTEYEVEEKHPEHGKSIQCLLNPADHSNYKIDENQPLHITLPHRWDKDESGRRVCLSWQLTKVPSWLSSIGCDTNAGSKGIFKFTSKLPEKPIRHHEASGVVEFQLSDKKSRKRIRLTCKGHNSQKSLASTQ